MTENSREKNFFAKLMLFGEYSVLLGSKALSIPYRRFSAHLDFINDNSPDSEDSRNSNQRIHEIVNYFHSNPVYFNKFLDLQRLDIDAGRGLFLDSNIPQGYGLGSSGALCAALYSEYALDPVDPGDFSDMKKISGLTAVLASMESLFHGKSSGFDPASCFLQQPLLIDEKRQLSIPDLHPMSLVFKDHLFLVDTGSVEKTSPLVKAFFAQFVTGGQPTSSALNYIRTTDRCIETILSGQEDLFWQSMKEFSAFQFRHLTYMIPEKLRPLWGEGLEKDLFYLKLCGSGGGGYLLGFSPQPGLSCDYISKLGFDLILV